MDYCDTKSDVPIELFNAIISNDFKKIDQLGSENKINYNPNLQYRSHFHVAASRGNLEAFELLMKYDDNIDCLARHGFTPFYCASRHGHIDIIKLLIKSGSKAIDILGGYEVPIGPIHIAAFYGHDHIIATLLEANQSGKNKRLHTVDKNGCSVLYYAMVNNQLQTVKNLINMDSTLLTISSNDGILPIHLATSNGFIKIIRLIVKKDHSMLDNFNNDENITPIYIATVDSQFDIIQCLIELGSTGLNIPDKNGYLPIHIAAKKGYAHIVDYFVKVCNCSPIVGNHINGNTPMHYAIQDGHIKVVESLFNLDNTALSVTNNNNNLPIYFAFEKERILPNIVELLKFLIKMDNNILNIPASNGSMLINFVAALGLIEIIEYIVSLNHKVDVPNNIGELALHYAAGHGQLDALKTLIRLGSIGLTSSATDGRTPIHYAASYGHADIVEYLIGEFGSDVMDTPNSKGITLIHYACAYGHVNVIETLIKLGYSDIYLLTNLKHSIIHCAAERGHCNIIEYIRRLNETHNNIEPLTLAKLDAITDLNVTPLFFASMFNNYNFVELLIQLGSKAINIPDINGYHPICAAISKEDIMMVQTLVSLDSSILDNIIEKLVDKTGRFIHIPKKMEHFLAAISPDFYEYMSVYYSSNEIKYDEDKAYDARYSCYFYRSLVSRLLLACEMLHLPL